MNQTVYPLYPHGQKSSVRSASEKKLREGWAAGTATVWLRAGCQGLAKGIGMAAHWRKSDKQGKGLLPAGIRTGESNSG